MSTALVLRRPGPHDEDEVMRAHRATTPGTPHFLHHYQDGMPFRRYLQVLEEQERGVALLPGHVPSTFLFAFVDQRVVGRITIRHRLTDALARVGGHVGFVVVPEFRRRGYATAMLRLALQIARDRLGLDRVLLTCDDDNAGSIHTIERSGGVLQDLVSDPESDIRKRRYWIDLRQER